jgi:alpha-galactosidase/6-phospho-beta-glucosidase family protein
MSIVLFNDITTEETLRQLEATGDKYKDLYVDMNEKEQRKYVKDSASVINDMLKKLDRARIDKSKEYKAKVEAEAKSIRERLQAANEPFTALIDAYNIERKKILDEKKEREAAVELAKLIESDHEIALILNTQ